MCPSIAFAQCFFLTKGPAFHVTAIIGFLTGWSYFSMSFDGLAAKVDCDWLSFGMWRVPHGLLRLWTWIVLEGTMVTTPTQHHRCLPAPQIIGLPLKLAGGWLPQSLLGRNQRLLADATNWSSRLQENYPSFERNLQNLPHIYKAKPEDVNM